MAGSIVSEIRARHGDEGEPDWCAKCEEATPRDAIKAAGLIDEMGHLLYAIAQQKCYCGNYDFWGDGWLVACPHFVAQRWLREHGMEGK